MSMNVAQVAALAPWGAFFLVFLSVAQAISFFLCLRRTAHAVGKVVEVEKLPQKTHLTVEYVTQRGKRCRSTITSFFDGEEWRKGKTVALRYEIKRPTRVILERRLKARRGRVFALFGAGLLLLMVGLAFG